MNTENDVIDNEKLMELLKAVEPSWKQQTIRPNPQTAIYEQPITPRRAIFQFDQFGGTNLNVGNGGGGGPSQPPPPLELYAVSGNMNGQPFPAPGGAFYLYGPPDQ